MKKIITLLFLGLNAFFIQAQDTNIVLELFTSQGCSSCPSADQLLKEVSESNLGKNVIVLSYHVDYWNRLGWKDPYSKAAYTNYQRAYGLKFGRGSIYTPQLVINGDKHIVGSDAEALRTHIRSFNKSTLPVNIQLSDLENKEGVLVVNYVVEGLNYDKVNFVLLAKEKTTEVKRGENSNRTLINTHIVLDKKIINKSLNSEKGAITFNLPQGYDVKDVKLAAYSQTEKLSITGATEI